MKLNQLSNMQLLKLYGDILSELKQRKVIRTNNFVGEIGEHIAVDFYNNTKHLPKLQIAPTSTKNIDAISNNGERYSIKCTTSKTTGVFYGLPEILDTEKQPLLFEHIVLVMLNRDFRLEKILELNWQNFLKHKRWHSRMKAWNLSITKALIADTKILFDSNI